MKILFPIQLVFFGLLALVATSIATAFAAGMTVPPSSVDEDSIAIMAEDLKPSACAGLSLINIIGGSGTLTGTSGNDLILGSSGTDTIDGLGGDDCIVGGGSDDTITGGDGSDICIGGPGTDTFTGCEGDHQ